MITESIIKLVVNKKFKRFGKMLILNINSKEKTIFIEVLPKGEREPIKVNIGHYEILTGQVNGIRLEEINTSREWITELVQTLVPAPIIESDYTKLLKIIL